MARDVLHSRVMQLTPDYVRALLGDLDDLTVARILDTAATTSELQEAVGEVRLEDEAGEPGPPPPSGRVAQLRALINDIYREDELDSE